MKRVKDLINRWYWHLFCIEARYSISNSQAMTHEYEAQKIYVS